jgi:hypothetical protein
MPVQGTYFQGTIMERGEFNGQSDENRKPFVKYFWPKKPFFGQNVKNRCKLKTLASF